MMIYSISNKKRLLAATIMLIFVLVSIMSSVETVSAASKLKVTPAKKTIYVGSSVTLKANKKVKWSIIKDKKIVKLTSKKKKSVKVKGLKAGTAVIKVKAGKSTKKVKIVVKKKAPAIPANAPKAISIVSNKKVVGVNENCTISIDSITPEGAAKDVIYTSSDESIATVSQFGLVTGVSSGTATITAQSKLNKAVTSSVDITVVNVKQGVVSITVDMTDAERYPAGKVAKVWLPVPTTDNDQKITVVRCKAPAAETAFTEDSCGDKVLYIEWGEDVAPEDRTATLSFHVNRKAVARPADLASLENGTVDTTEFAEYLKETAMSGSMTEGIVKETADKIVSEAGATTVYDKAHAIYNWVCDNMSRNGQSKYKLRGDVVGMLTDGMVGATCVDINATFVALCRAEGIPAREIIGMWFDKKSPKCRAQFFLPGYGWVEADPSQPLKVIMQDDIRGQAEFAESWEGIKDEYWGQANEMWMMFTFGRDITLDPPQSAEPGTDGILTDDGKLNVFMFPYGEFDGQYIPSEDDENFKYQYDFVEDDPNDCC